MNGTNAKPKVTPLRLLTAQNIGGLVTISGVVTRATDVKPCIQCACYACDTCGMEMMETVPGRFFTPRTECMSESCKTNQVRGNITLQVRGSKFTSYQDIKIQESSDQVPMGHVPRMMSIVARGELTRQCGPGDMITVTGVYCPTFISAGRGMIQRSSTLHDVCIEAFKIQKAKKSFTERVGDDMMTKVEAERSSAIYSKVLCRHNYKQ